MTRRRIVILGVLAAAGMIAIVAGGAYVNRDEPLKSLPPLPAWAINLDADIGDASHTFSARVEAQFRRGTNVELAQESLKTSGFSEQPERDGWRVFKRTDASFPCLAERTVAWTQDTIQITESRGTYRYICP